MTSQPYDWAASLAELEEEYAARPNEVVKTRIRLMKLQKPKVFIKPKSTNQGVTAGESSKSPSAPPKETAKDRLAGSNEQTKGPARQKPKIMPKPKIVPKPKGAEQGDNIGGSGEDKSAESPAKPRIGTTKEASEYSTNSSTVRNQKNWAAAVAKSESDPTLLKYMRAKNSQNTAISRAWTKFSELEPVKNAIAAVSGNSAKALTAELRIQNSNAVQEQRFMQSKHWTQELPNHPDAKNAKVTYFTAQNRVFQLDDKNMPPDCIKQLAKVMVKIEDDGSLTESPIEKEDDADGETDEDNMPQIDYSQMSEDRQEQFREERRRMHNEGWWAIQRYWYKALREARAKVKCLNEEGLEGFIKRCSAYRWEQICAWVSPGDYVFMNKDIALDSRCTVLSGYRETSDATYRGEILEDELESGLPLPPYSLLFSRPQRVIMALLLQCQTNGAFQQSDLMLTAKLPKPFGEYNQTSQMCPVKFPQGWVDDEWAEWFLEAMDPQRDAGVPANYDDAIALQDIGKLDFQPDELGLNAKYVKMPNVNHAPNAYDALWDHEIEEMGDIDVNGNEVYVIHKIADAQVRKENIEKAWGNLNFDYERGEWDNDSGEDSDSLKHFVGSSFDINKDSASGEKGDTDEEEYTDDDVELKRVGFNDDSDNGSIGKADKEVVDVSSGSEVESEEADADDDLTNELDDLTNVANKVGRKRKEGPSKNKGRLKKVK